MSKLTALVVVLAVCAVVAFRHSFGNDRVMPLIERFIGAMARRKTAICLSMGLLVLLARTALLPVWPIPQPSIPDEFGYLLGADTFAHGRLTNPPHPLWQFFESIYILQQPTYTSKYPPGQSLVMAAGQRLFGHPWFGVWLSCGALAALLCWALQGWLPPAWALLGSVISLDLCLFSYWMNSYWGGAVTGIGGALVVGAWPRIVRTRQTRYAWVFGAGAVVLLLTRPYEGFLLVAPAVLALWTNVKQDRTRVWLPVLALAAAGFSWQAFYDYRVTGHPLRMPYQEYSSQYESIPQLIILPVQPPKIYRHLNLEFHESGWTRQINGQARSWRLQAIRAADLYQTAAIMFGHPLWLVFLLIFCPWWLVSRRLRLPVIWAGCLVGGAMIELIFFAHYAAPFTAALLILLLQALRHLWIWSVRHLPGRRQAGRFVIAALAVAVVGLGLAVRTVQIVQHRTPDRLQAANALKSTIERDLLKRLPGRHVIFVRYTGTQIPHEEWIYNLSDIDGSEVIWSQDMGSQNVKLMAYYPGRSFWLFDPDRDHVHLQPYPEP